MRDFEKITDEEFDNMPRSERAALMREYGQSIGRDMSDHEAGLLADHHEQVRLAEREARDVQSARESDHWGGGGGALSARASEPWNEIERGIPRQHDREMAE